MIQRRDLFEALVCVHCVLGPWPTEERENEKGRMYPTTRVCAEEHRPLSTKLFALFALLFFFFYSFFDSSEMMRRASTIGKKSATAHVCIKKVP